MGVKCHSTARYQKKYPRTCGQELNVTCTFFHRLKISANLHIAFESRTAENPKLGTQTCSVDKDLSKVIVEVSFNTCNMLSDRRPGLWLD